jgi:hypothetical protein
VIKSILQEFIIQAQQESLKTSHYPKDYSDLRMKVSFGQGVAARVPWISFTAQGMSTSNGYYPVYLYYKDQDLLVLSFGLSETSEYSSTWPEEVTKSKIRIRELIDAAPRYGDSYVFKVYSPKINGQSVEFVYEGSLFAGDQMERDLQQILNTYKQSLDLEVKDERSITSSGLFYLESQLEDFLIENWASTPFGQELELLTEEGELISQQFRTDIGRIDILARDKKSSSYVVLELKRNQTSDDTVGQVLRYMGWVKQNLGDAGVRGVIVAGKYDEKLDYARQMIPGLEVFIYEVNFSLKEHTK